MSATAPGKTGTIPESLATMGRHWGLVLTFGILSVLVGLIALIWPGITFAVFAVFFGAWLFVSGIVQLVQSFAGEASGGGRVLLAISGVCGIVLGLLCFRSAMHAAYILTLLIGIGWIIRGVMTFVAGISAAGAPGRGWAIFSGVVLFIGGIVVLEWPINSAVTLAVVSGIFVLLFGIMEIVGALQLRKLA
ncbi:MAG: HdeD family acid-resistance protein [Candidatus Nanopelagicales bacterium]